MKVLFRNFSEGTEETHKDLSQYIRCPDRDSNLLLNTSKYRYRFSELGQWRTFMNMAYMQSLFPDCVEFKMNSLWLQQYDMRPNLLFLQDADDG
jgi:hypothetical protein